jgi:hypothetical protein
MGDIISGQKAPLGRILRNFRLYMRTPKGTPKGSRDLRSLPVALPILNSFIKTKVLLPQAYMTLAGFGYLVYALWFYRSQTL